MLYNWRTDPAERLCSCALKLHPWSVQGLIILLLESRADADRSVLRPLVRLQRVLPWWGYSRRSDSSQKQTPAKVRQLFSLRNVTGDSMGPGLHLYQGMPLKLLPLLLLLFLFFFLLEHLLSIYFCKIRCWELKCRDEWDIDLIPTETIFPQQWERICTSEPKGHDYNPSYLLPSCVTLTSYLAFLDLSFPIRKIT